MTNQLIQIANVQDPTEQDIIVGFQRMMFQLRNTYFKEGAQMPKETFQTYMEVVSEELTDCNLLGAVHTVGLFYNHLEGLRKEALK